MKEIKHPAFMREAAKGKRGNAAFIEVLLACLIFVISGFAMGIVQLPAFIMYMFSDEEYMRLMMSGDVVSVEKAMEKVLQLPDWLVIVSLVSEIMMIVVVILYCRLFEKRKAATMGFQGPVVRQYLAGAVGAVLVFSTAYLVCVLTGSIQFNGLAKNMVPGYILAYLFGYMIQGMAEEVLCRGYLMVSLTHRYSVLYSAVVSSVFFALLHGMNAGLTLLALVNLFLYGMFAALLFVKYENIWIVGAFHSLWNFVQGNLYGIQVSGTGFQNSVFASTTNKGMSFINGGAFGMEGGIAVTIVLTAGIVLLWRMLGREGKLIELQDVQNTNIRNVGMRSANVQNTKDMRSAEDTQNAEDMRNTDVQNAGIQGADIQKAEAVIPGSVSARKRQADERENMGVRPGETPWRPDNAREFNEQNSSQPEPMNTTFNADYFKD